MWETFAAVVAAVGFGTIVAAVVAHRTAISNHRQKWINGLRDDLAGYFKELGRMNDLMPFYLEDSRKHESEKDAIRAALFFAFERIRLRLNSTEILHLDLEKKLREFLDEPISQAMAGRLKVDEAVGIARRVLKREWQVAKHPWLALLRRMCEGSN